MTTDRGLCGGFNGSICRTARVRIRALQSEGKQVKLLIVGRKGRGILRGEYGNLIIDTLEDTAKPSPLFETAAGIAERVTQMFEAGEFDVCTLIYNKRSEEHTSELQSLMRISYAVFCLKKKKNSNTSKDRTTHTNT